MQFSDYSHPEWCEEKKFTKVEITGEKQSALTVDTASNKLIIDGSKEVNQEQFAALCDYFNTNRDAIKSLRSFDQTIGLLISSAINSENIGAFAVNAAPDKSMILFTAVINEMGTSGVLSTDQFSFAIFNKPMAFKNLTAPAYTWVLIAYNDVINNKQLSETEVELIDYKLTLDISDKATQAMPDFDQESAKEVAVFSVPLGEMLFNGLNVYGIIGGEVKEPVFNFATNCNLFIDNMR